MRKLCSEAEAGNEAIEAVGVEKVGRDREVMLKDFPLFLGERILQLGIKVAMLLRKLLDFAARTDGALAGCEISVVKVFQYVRHDVVKILLIFFYFPAMRQRAKTCFCVLRLSELYQPSERKSSK